MLRSGLSETASQSKISQLESSIQQVLLQRPRPAQLLFALQSPANPLRQLLDELGVAFNFDIDEDLNDSFSTPTPETYTEDLATLLSHSFVNVSEDSGITLSLPVVAEAFATEPYQQFPRPDFIADIELSLLLTITEELLHLLQVVTGARTVLRMVSKTERVLMAEVEQLSPLPTTQTWENFPEAAKVFLLIAESDITYWMLEHYNGDYLIEYEGEFYTCLARSGISNTSWWKFRLAEYGKPLGLKSDTAFVMQVLSEKET